MKPTLTEDISEVTDVALYKTMETESFLFMRDKEKYQYKFDKTEEHLFIRVYGEWTSFAKLETIKIESFWEKIFLSVKFFGKAGVKKFFEKMPPNFFQKN